MIQILKSNSILAGEWVSYSLRRDSLNSPFLFFHTTVYIGHCITEYAQSVPAISFLISHPSYSLHKLCAISLIA